MARFFENIGVHCKLTKESSHRLDFLVLLRIFITQIILGGDAMVDVLEEYQGFAERSIVAQDRKNQESIPEEDGVVWVCGSEHRDGEMRYYRKIGTKGRPVCPECGALLTKTKPTIGA